MTSIPDSIAHSNRHLPQTHLAHHIIVEPGSRMETILGAREVRVNSLHHQAYQKIQEKVCASLVTLQMAFRSYLK